MLHFVLAAAHALALGGNIPLRAPTCAANRMMPRGHAAVGPAMISMPFGSSSGGGASGPSEETLAAYRLMGLDLDATYDEIESSFDTLLVEYKGDPKKKIKLQVAKDRILEDRLRQRMAGGIAGFTGIKDPFDVPEGPKPFFKIPPRLQGIMELPDKELVTKNALIFGILSVLPLASAAWASTSLAMGFAISLYLLYNRGVDNSSEMGAEMRQYKAKPLIMAVGITLLLASISASVLQLFYAPLSRMFGFVSQEFLIALGGSIGFGTAASLFKVQDEY